MNVFLTIDVESYAGDYEREVFGAGKGLDYLLARLREHGTKATFFVEALGATRWGLQPLCDVCRRIQEAGQEIQLHVHPVVANLSGFDGQGDVLWHHDRPTQERLMAEGTRILKACGVLEIQAFRAGDFAADENTLRAMENLGIGLGSNRDLDFKCSTRSRVNDRFPVRNDLSKTGTIADLPLTVFRSPLPALDGRFRHLEISAVGSREGTDTLCKLAAAGYACATLLTHPAEFFRWSGGEAIPIIKNCRRLEGLLAFLDTRKDLAVLPMSQCLARATLPVAAPPDVTPNLFHTLERVCEQVAERVRRW